MNLENILTLIGAIAIILIIIIIILIPIICILILGDYTATHYFHLNGIVYWAYIIMFYIIGAGIIGAIMRINK